MFSSKLLNSPWTLPTARFVCCPNLMRCQDTSSAHLPWAHSLNWIVRLASFPTMNPGNAHALLLTLCPVCVWHQAVRLSTEKTLHTYTYTYTLTHTHTHTTPNASNQGHQVPGLVFGGWWVIFWSMSAFLSPPLLPRGNEGMISLLSSTRHSPRKQTGTFYGLLVDLQPRSNNNRLQVMFTSGWAT